MSTNSGYVVSAGLPGPIPATWPTGYYDRGVGARFSLWAVARLAEHTAAGAATDPEYTETVHLLPGGRVELHLPAGVTGGAPHVEVIMPDATGAYAIGECWAWDQVTPREAFTEQLRALLRPRCEHRAFRAAVALHAVARLLQDRVTRQPALAPWIPAQHSHDQH